MGTVWLNIPSRYIVVSGNLAMTMSHTIMLLPFLATLVVLTSCTCSVSSPDDKAKASDDATYQAACIAALENEVRIEFEASLQYILMAAHFSQDTVNLPKVAELFWTHADEERSHAIQFINYLRMRGAEKDVTSAMKNMIDICSAAGQDDPHAADWLTGTWLEEQLQGQRNLAGLINTFNNFKRGHEELAEWLFDMEL